LPANPSIISYGGEFVDYFLCCEATQKIIYKYQIRITVRQLFTADDIRRLASEQNSASLLLGPDDLVTPQAVDVARELGLRLIREDPGSAQAPASPRPSASASLPPLKKVTGARVSLDLFGEGTATPGANVRLKDVITSADGSPMAAGYMALDQGEFPWTLTYDEVDIVLEGELVIRRGDVEVRGGPGDVIFIPKGSSITFGTPSRVRFLYVTYPADWNEGA
jgi:ethanolamine utilization protein EutQ